MTPSILAALLSRELRTLQREVEAYPSDALIWAAHPGLPNTGGTLALHAAGNLQHFIGAVLGGTGYVRDRDAEFARRDVPRAALLRELEAAVSVVERVVPALPPAVLESWYPEPVAKRRVRTDEFLAHLEAHLAYHVGQADYHRRAVTGENRGVGAVAPAELPGAVPLEV
jgi:hypothetical protein